MDGLTDGAAPTAEEKHLLLSWPSPVWEIAIWIIGAEQELSRHTCILRLVMQLLCPLDVPPEIATAVTLAHELFRHFRCNWTEWLQSIRLIRTVQHAASYSSTKLHACVHVQERECVCESVTASTLKWPNGLLSLIIWVLVCFFSSSQPNTLQLDNGAPARWQLTLTINHSLTAEHRHNTCPHTSTQPPLNKLLLLPL